MTRDPVVQIEQEVATLTRALQWIHRPSPGYEVMTRASYLLARAVDELEPASVNELAAAMGVDATTVTRQLGNLEADGTIKRAADPADGRVRRIRLTADGRRRMELVRAQRLERTAGLLHDWSPSDRAAFADLLARFNRALASRPDEPRAE